MSEITVIIQLVLFVVLLCTLIYLSVIRQKVKTIPKWVLIICTVSILAMADKFKLIAAIGLAAIVYFIKYFHPKKHKHGVKHNW